MSWIDNLFSSRAKNLLNDKQNMISILIRSIPFNHFIFDQKIIDYAQEKIKSLFKK